MYSLGAGSIDFRHEFDPAGQGIIRVGVYLNDA